MWWGGIFKQYKQDELNKGGTPYAERVKAKRKELIESLKASGDQDVVNLEKMTTERLNKRIDAKIGGPLDAFAKKHQLTLNSYDDFNNFLSSFLGTKGSAGSISDMNKGVKDLDTSFDERLKRRKTYLENEIRGLEANILKRDFKKEKFTDLTDAELAQLNKKTASDPLIQNLTKLKNNVVRGQNLFGLDDISSLDQLIRRKDDQGNFVGGRGTTPHEKLYDIINTEKASFYAEKDALGNKINEKNWSRANSLQKS